jgi:serine/threonine-protein kinase
VGPYRLLRVLGEGGMATVWLAERTDQLQGRRIALKLPHGAWRRSGLAERMAREREILATLEHPNIARLYDAGVDADGQPYLAIEYVEGERIDAFAARHALTLPQRLQLFLQVARAVAHAHANLVVHRDLKPSNILVTAAGEVRLLDFGIAKLLEQGVAEETALTREVGRALTPDYAAPEQIQGKPIGTAADVYALGVVLFELLSGQRPYRLVRESRAALEEAIVRAEPMRPSDAASDPALRRALRGDLDTIVLKALSKLPAQRYATVDAMADDIRRHLAREPVLARPEARLYRAGRFVARHRLQVGAAAAVVLALLGGAGAAWWQAGQARLQRDAALRAQAAAVAQAEAAREAERLAGAQTDLASFLLADLSRGRTQQEMSDQLERAVTMVREQYRGDVPLRGQLLFELGERLRGLSNFARANALFDESEPLLRQSANVPTLARLLCLRARDAVFDGAAPRAHALLAEAEALLASSDRPVVRPIRAACRLEAAAVARILGDMPRAVAAAEEARQLELAGGLGHTESHAETLNALGRAYFQAGRYRDAADTTRASLALREQLGRARTPGAMNAEAQLAAALREGGRPMDALQRHAALQGGASGGEGVTGPRVLSHATTLVTLGRHAEALPMLQQLLDDAQRRNDRTEVRAITVLRAHAQTDSAALADARRSVEEAERLYAELRQQRRYVARLALLARARLSLAQRDAPAAAAALGEARDIVQRTGYAEDPAWRQIHDGEARLALLRGDAAAARASAAAALAIARRQAIDADASLHIAEALLLQAQALHAAGDIAAARADAASAARHAQLTAGADHPVTRAARAWPT